MKNGFDSNGISRKKRWKASDKGENWKRIWNIIK
jgi:hypothetical protein